MLVSTSIDAVQTVATKMENDALKVPPPPAGVEEWPVIGKSVDKAWSLASSNLDAALQKFAPQIKSLTTAMLGKI